MSYAATVLADSPLAYYRLDEGSGTTMSDSSGNSRGGTYINGATPTATSLLASDSDLALTCDGVDDYASVTYGSWMQTTTAFSIEFWFKPSTISGSHIAVARSNNAGPFGNTYAWLFYQTGATLTYYVFTGNSSTFVGVNMPTSLVAGTTYHIVGTYDGTTMRLYVNGSQVATGSISGSMNTAPNIDLTIGACHAGASSERFAGTIDEVAVYNAVLSSSQVTAHYNVGVATVTSQSAALSGSGTLSASVSSIAVAAAGFTGDGTLSAAAVQITSVTANFSGSGTLSGGVTTTTVTADFSGSGALSAAAMAIPEVSGNLSGAGALSATAAPTSAATAGFSGTGTLSAAVVQVAVVTAAFSGGGSLSSAITPVALLNAAFAGSGELVADAEALVVTEVSGSLDSEGALVADVQIFRSGGVRRWVFFDPSNGEQWIFPINPNHMNSPFSARNMSLARGTLNGPDRIRAVDLAPPGPPQWTFGGVVLTQDQHDTLASWAKRNRHLRLTDHLGRTFEVVVQNFVPTDRRPTPARPWRGQYEMTCLVLSQVGS